MNQVTQGADWMEGSACNNAACFTPREEDLCRVTHHLESYIVLH